MPTLSANSPDISLSATPFLELDKGPWRYNFEASSAHSHFVESADFSDVRLYINGNFGSNAEQEAYGKALARTLNESAGTPLLSVGQRQLDALETLAKMASTFADELSRNHPDVIEAFVALEVAQKPSNELLLVVPFETQLSTDNVTSEERERAMLAEILAWRKYAGANNGQKLEHPNTLASTTPP